MAASEGNQAIDVDSYLTLIDLINTKLIAFKQKYANFKERAIAEYKAQLAKNEQEP